jgi:glutamate racemase
VMLACTHYPLLLPRLQRLAPWPVDWIDPAPAIARRTAQLLGPAQLRPGPAATVAIFTDGVRLSGPAHIALAGFGLARVEQEAMPLRI